MIDTLTSCMTTAERRVEARRIEGEERAADYPRNPVTCEHCQGEGGFDDTRSWEDPQNTRIVMCETCFGFGVVEGDEDE